jgi:hypothetical protein
LGGIENHQYQKRNRERLLHGPGKVIQLGSFLSMHISHDHIQNNRRSCYGCDAVDERLSLEVVMGPLDARLRQLSAELVPLIPEFLVVLETDGQGICGAINDLLQLLPNDATLVALSCRSGTFIQEFTRVQSSHYHKYILKILAWLLKHQGFVGP